MTAHKKQTTARWDRLIEALADVGIRTEAAYQTTNVVAFGRTRKTTFNVLRIRVDDRLIEVEDQQVDGQWIGWTVALSTEGVIVRQWPPSRFPLTVSQNVRQATAIALLVDEEAGR